MSGSTLQVAKRAAMVREIHRKFPQLSDLAISRMTNISRDMVRRHRLGLTKAIYDPELILQVNAIIQKYK